MVVLLLKETTESHPLITSQGQEPLSNAASLL